MAINKKLIHFQTKTAFTAELNAGNILDTSIVFIKDTKEIWTHGQFYSCSLTEADKQWIDIVKGNEDTSGFGFYVPGDTTDGGGDYIWFKTLKYGEEQEVPILNYSVVDALGNTVDYEVPIPPATTTLLQGNSDIAVGGSFSAEQLKKLLIASSDNLPLLFIKHIDPDKFKNMFSNDKKRWRSNEPAPDIAPRYYTEDIYEILKNKLDNNPQLKRGFILIGTNDGAYHKFIMPDRQNGVTISNGIITSAPNLYFTDDAGFIVEFSLQEGQNIILNTVDDGNRMCQVDDSYPDEDGYYLTLRHYNINTKQNVYNNLIIPLVEPYEWSRGVMSGDDKAKLDNIGVVGTKLEIDTVDQRGITLSLNTLNTKTGVTSENLVELQTAQPIIGNDDGAAGLMSAEDKTKLDNLETDVLFSYEISYNNPIRNGFISTDSFPGTDSEATNTSEYNQLVGLVKKIKEFADKGYKSFRIKLDFKDDTRSEYYYVDIPIYNTPVVIENEYVIAMPDLYFINAGGYKCKLIGNDVMFYVHGCNNGEKWWDGYDIATKAKSGLISKEDKTKLDNLFNSMEVMTQSQYNSLTTKEPNKIYFIKG